MTIAVVGKYTVLKDAYKSLIEALHHGGVANNVKVNIDWVEADTFEGDPQACEERLQGAHAVLVPAALASAARKARSRRRVSPASATSPISASASACRWR